MGAARAMLFPRTIWDGMQCYLLRIFGLYCVSLDYFNLNFRDYARRTIYDMVDADGRPMNQSQAFEESKGE